MVHGYMFVFSIGWIGEYFNNAYQKW